MSTNERFTILAHLVVQTYVVARNRALSHYEIQLALDDGPKTPRVTLLTNDEALYAEALALEGSDIRVDVAWRAGRRQTGQVAQLLTALRRHREAA